MKTVTAFVSSARKKGLTYIATRLTSVRLDVE